MGFLNLMRDAMREHGRTGLNSIRDIGKIVAPTLTKRAGKYIHRNRRLVRALSKSTSDAFDVVDAATVGDLAGGLHATVHLGQSAAAVFKSAKKGGMQPKRKGKIPDFLQTKKKRIGTDASGGSSLEQFDSGVANDPKISGDMLARMTKSVRGF